MGKHKKRKHQLKGSAAKPRNADIEMRWVGAWYDLCDLVGNNSSLRCLLPDGVVVDFDGGKAWLQNSVYQGYQITVEGGEVLGRPGVILLRSK